MNDLNDSINNRMMINYKQFYTLSSDKEIEEF